MRNARPRSLTTRSSLVLARLAPVALLACGALLTGCSGDDGPPPPPIGEEGVTLTLGPANNYTSTSHLTIESLEVAEDNLTICWDKITKDLQCHPTSAVDDIDDVSLVRVNSDSQDEVTGWIDRGELISSLTDGYFEYKPTAGDGQCADLEDFKDAGGDPIDIGEKFNEDPDVTYLLVFASGTKIGFGSRTMYYLEPGAGTQTDVNAYVDSCKEPTKMLDFNATLSDEKVTVPAKGPWDVDFSALKVDSQGNKIVRDTIDSLLIGFYKDRDVADLEENFLFLQDQTAATGGPDRSWKVGIASGTAARLSGAKGRNGEPDFVDFDTGSDTGTWVLGLFCSTCQNPAPIFVTVLDPQ